ncbi:unnamed protein product [Symbiodinium sp. CCMP2456]|nr:unnamed protein product [Symbiodinium sp. CCMP2456]
MQRALVLLWFSATSVETTLPATDVDAALREEFDKESCPGAAGEASWLQRSARRKSLQELHEGSETRQNASVALSEDKQYCDSHTGGSCRFWSCSSSRGPTMCTAYQCLCKPGFCAVDGVCKERTAHAVDTCGRQTGGSCTLWGCASYRGPVECVNQECVCKEGYCSAGDGTCKRPKPAIKARVAAVNSRQPFFPDSQAQVRTGICFSGGGSRALSVTLGVLRALESLQLIPHIDAISSVSGGTWASSIYMFAKDVSVKELLGEDTVPNDLTMDRLEREPPRLGDVATTSINIFWTIVGKWAHGKSNPRDMWIDVYAKTVLEPFGLANRSQFMAADEASLQRILAENPSLQREQFLIPNPLRPKTYIMGGTILAPVGLEATERSAVNLQMSPDYTGSPFYPQDKVVSYDGKDTREFLLGGGLVESFAFGGSAPISENGQMGGSKVSMEAPPSAFSLADAVGISSAAFASVLVTASGWMHLFAQHAQEYLPTRDYWPVTSALFKERRPAMKHVLGDGAETDNTGMMALLQRRASKIVVVHSTNVELSEEIDFCGSLFDITQLALHGKVSNDLLDKFGYIAENPGEYLVHNQVFNRNELQPLLCEFQKKRKSGDALVVERQLQVLENKKWGIQGNWKASVIFVYLNSCKRFDVNLPPETLQEVQKGSGGKFAHWPHFKTSNQNSGKFTTYTNEQVNLLSAFGEYMIRSNEDMFMRFFRSCYSSDKR